MSPEELAALIGTGGGVLISLALAYIPGVKQWWDARTGNERRAVLAISYVAIGALLFLPACTGGPVIIACSTASIWPVVVAIVTAAIGSQTMYQHLPNARKRQTNVVVNNTTYTGSSGGDESRFIARHG